MLKEVVLTEPWGGVAVGHDPLDLIRRPGAVTVVFQPIIDLNPQSPLLHGLECLSRGPEGTPLHDATALFSLVRQRGVEQEIDRLCLGRALDGARALPTAPAVSVNVHARTLAGDPAFFRYVMGELERVGRDPQQLTLDVRASDGFGEGLAASLAALRAVGVRIAIDDLGTGYTDFEGLLACQADYLKLDRSFVKQASIGYSPDLRELMLESMVRLARGMGAEPLAEGVETLEELDGVLAHGVRLVQGWFFSEPLAAEALRSTGLFGPETGDAPRSGSHQLYG